MEDLIGLGLAVATAAFTYLFLKRDKVFLKDPSQRYEVELVSKEVLGKNVVKLRFGLPSDVRLGLNTGNHIQLSAEINGEMVHKSYTPITLYSTKGFFEIIIKVYNPTPEQPKGGLMTRYLDSLPNGEKVLVRGPTGQSQYLGNQQWSIKQRGERTVKTVKQLALLAGGSGITPMLQIIHRILSEPNDQTNIKLLFANSTSVDVFLKEYLDELASDERLRVFYTVSRDPHPEWRHSVGRVNNNMIQQCFPAPSSDLLVFVCGPRGFHTNAAAVLESLEYSKDSVINL